MKPKRIQIVDDHVLVRHGIAQLLSAEPDLSICSQESTADDALRSLKQNLPDLVITDLSLPGISGLELVRSIRHRFPVLPILVLSMYDETLYAERVLRLGANGYVMKQEAPDILIQAVREVMVGRIYVSDRMRTEILTRLVYNKGEEVDSPISGLSAGEYEVLQLIGQGFGSSDIANRLNRSVKTIESHRANIRRKLNLKDGRELMRFAMQWLDGRRE